MASVDRVERELGDAKTEYRRCVEELKEFRKGEKGDRLEELKKNLREKEDVDENQRKKWTEEKEDLEKQEKKLEIEKDEWKEELLKWAEKLRTATDDTATGQEKKFTDNPNLYFQTLKMLSAKPQFIPGKLDLFSWLQQPPMNPIEVYPSLYERHFKEKLPSDDLNKIFVSSGNSSLEVWNEFIMHIAVPPFFGTTENSFIAFWDALIVKPFLIGSQMGKYDRNTSLHTSTRKLRPDLSYLVSDACLARGEEKGLETEGDPAKELTEKLTWTYGRCPYIFGYYARATTVTYSYLYLEGEQVLRKDLFTCELVKLEGRIQAWIIGINIGRLLPLLRQTVPDYFQREFVILHRSNGKVVELMQKVVVKRYPSIESVINIKAIYDAMTKHRVPFTDQLQNVNADIKKTPFMILSPKGMTSRPQSKEQLIKALCCVLTALKALHKIKIMHRDIRWENVLKFIDRDKWFIIDFDDACYTTELTSGAHLAAENHAPEISEDNHNESVDIWSVGYLILTAPAKLQESDKLKAYARKLSAINKLHRPTAEEALEWLWSEYYDILREEFLEE